MARDRGRPIAMPLTSLFSSSVLPEIVALIDRLGPLSIEELAAHTSASRVTVAREIHRLADLGVASIMPSRNRRLVTLSDSPSAQKVRDLAVLACGVPSIVATEFGSLEGVLRVVIYGSWAARNAGIPGRLPDDIDVLVIGSVDRDDVFEAAERATTRIGVPVSAQRVSQQVWEERSDAFLHAIQESTTLEVIP